MIHNTAQIILQKRMHGLYLSRRCTDLSKLSHELMGMHCWFHRNVVFSAVIRGAPLAGWKKELTKTWLYRGTLHGVNIEDLPTFLALRSDYSSFEWLGLKPAQLEDMADRVLRLMEDGVYSRTEMRRIFADDTDHKIIDRIFSSWGGIFVYLARQGRVAFRDMTSRNFDLIDAEPTQSHEEALKECLHRFFAAYGPATLEDAAWFLGYKNGWKEIFSAIDLSTLSRLEYNKGIYYYEESPASQNDIPELTLLSGFDPLIVSYTNREIVLPKEYKKAVILSSGICLPTIAVNGRVAGLWNIKNNEPVISFFESQPKRIKDKTAELVDNMCRQAGLHLK